MLWLRLRRAAARCWRWMRGDDPVRALDRAIAALDRERRRLRVRVVAVLAEAGRETGAETRLHLDQVAAQARDALAALDVRAARLRRRRQTLLDRRQAARLTASLAGTWRRASQKSAADPDADWRMEREVLLLELQAEAASDLAAAGVPAKSRRLIGRR